MNTWPTNLNWDETTGLLPVIVQDASTLQVLMLGYMNEESFERTKQTGRVTFYSRSRQTLWEKGESSGNTLHVRKVSADCDSDTLLILANPAGPTCHLGTDSCFADGAPAAILPELERTIQQRWKDAPEGSYTASLKGAGITRIAQKVGEEGVEVALAAATGAANLAEEVADLMYHTLVLLTASGLDLAAAQAVLEQRREKRS